MGFFFSISVNCTNHTGMTSVSAGVIAIAEINEALNSGDAEKTFAALTLPTAKLQGVNPDTAKHYHDLLLHTKDLICKVLTY